MWFFRGALFATRSHLSAWRSMPMASNGNAFIKSEHVITSQCSMMITLHHSSNIFRFLQWYAHIFLIIHHNSRCRETTSSLWGVANHEVLQWCARCAQRVLIFLGQCPMCVGRVLILLSWHVGMGTVDWGFFEVACGSGHHGLLKNQTVQEGQELRS